jgi:hypothetical protein
MSAYSEVQTTFRNPHLLLEALREMGVPEVQDHIGNPLQLEAYYADEKWDQKAEIIIPKRALGPVSNDIGFVKKADGTYGAVIGDIDDKKYNAAWMKRLLNVYSEKSIMAVARRKGLRFTGKKTVKGKIRLEFVQV